MRKLIPLIFKKNWCILLLFLANQYSLSAQINGIVTDAETKEPLIGASIIHQASGKGTVTDLDGQFSLDIMSSEILDISYTGYRSQQITIDTNTYLTIQLESGVLINEVVVTGYSIDTRRKTPGSVSTIKPRDLQITPSGNVEQQLMGRVPGVTVLSNGQPGTTSQIRIRGYGALGGNEPLYVVDGVPVNSIDFLAPNDIESTTVLKDATAASIYGARAAGGVIVYTTKKGSKSKQKMQIQYNGMLGVTTPENGHELMNPQDQATWTWTAIRNAALQAGVAPVFNHPQYGTGAQPVIPDYLLVGNEPGVVGTVNLADHQDLYNIDIDAGPIYQVVRANKEGTDWYDALMRNALLHRHHLGLAGGGAKNQYYVGLSMQQQEGIQLDQKMDRYSLRINTSFDIAPFLRFGENFQATYRGTSTLLGSGGGLGTATESNGISATRALTILPIYDEFGGFAGNSIPGGGRGNSVAESYRRENQLNFTTQAFGNIFLEVEPIENLIIKTSFGGRFSNLNSRSQLKKTYWAGLNDVSGSYTQLSAYTTQWVWTNTLQYRKKIGAHSLNVLFGQEALDQGSGYDINGFGLNPFSEDINFVGLSTVQAREVEGGPFKGVRFASYFGRLNYDFSDKYLLSLVLRRDGSSRFGRQNRYGTFPAFSAAWRLSSEDFMQGLSFIEDLKIRGGFGIMGNSNNVDPNNQFSLYSTNLDAASYDIGGTNTSAVEGFYRTRIGNPTAKWEKAITTNIGIDALLFNGRLDVGVEFWRKETTDLLFRLPVTVQTGFFAEAPVVNVGNMLNKGIDFIISTKGNWQNFRYQFSINGGFLENKIVALAPNLDNLPNRSIVVGVGVVGLTPILNQVGYPLSAFYGYEVQGLFQNPAEIEAAAAQEGAAPGRFRYKDINEDGIINLEDRTFLGSPIADFTGGLNLKLSYKNWELEVYGFASIGNEIYNVAKKELHFYQPDFAISEQVKDSWTVDNPNASIPLFENVANFSTSTQSNSYYVEDGSYFRLQNITLSYSFPPSLLRRWKMENIRLFVAANNLFTITGYSGLDPMVANNLDTNFGIDYANFPLTRSWVFGLNVGL